MGRSSHRPRGRAALAWVIVALLGLATNGAGDSPRGSRIVARESGTESASPTAIERADNAWRDRALGSEHGRADPGPIGSAVALYTRELAARPDDLVVRGKLLRALFFQGEYAAEGREARLSIHTRAQEIGEAGIEQLAHGAGGRAALDRLEPEELAEHLHGIEGAAAVYYWTGVHWGLWGRHRGPIAAARQGVAGKIRDYAERTIALDNRLENAGGHRLLGQLHAEAPKIPFFTGWIDRKIGVRELRLANELFPDDLLTRLYLAQALLDQDRGSQIEGIEMLHAIVASAPNPDWRVEEEDVILDARDLLMERGK